MSKSILKGLALAGGVAVACTSPNFLPKVIPEIIKCAKYKYKRRSGDKSFYNSFLYLRKNGYIEAENRNGQIYISLTKEGKKKAGRYQIDDLEIKKPKKWDGKWRILIFDVKDRDRIKREALRGKIKELGLYQLQKSVWVYPHPFYGELDLLRSFFNLTKYEMQFIVATSVENDWKAKKHFGLE